MKAKIVLEMLLAFLLLYVVGIVCYNVDWLGRFFVAVAGLPVIMWLIRPKPQIREMGLIALISTIVFFILLPLTFPWLMDEARHVAATWPGLGVSTSALVIFSTLVSLSALALEGALSIFRRSVSV